MAEADTHRSLIPLTPGTFVSTISGLVLLGVQIAAPMREIFSSCICDLMLPDWLRLPYWALFIVPLCAFVAMAGFIIRGRSLRSNRSIRLVVLPVSVLTLLVLIVIRLDCHYQGPGIWPSLFCTLAIFLGNILDASGVRWSSFPNLGRWLLKTFQARWHALRNKLQFWPHPNRIKLAALFGLVSLCLFAALYAARLRPFQNHVFACRYIPAEKSYPSYSANYYLIFGSEVSWAASLGDFCFQMRERFSNSNSSVAEARQLYARLKTLPSSQLSLLDQKHVGCYVPRPVRWEKQVLVRKIAEGSYEIFYYRTDYCVAEYEYGRVNLTGTGTEYRRLVMWRESFCPLR